jgi:leucyl-tRNA synthetase
MSGSTRIPQTPDTGSTHGNAPENAPGNAPAYRYTAALANDIETRWQKQWDADSQFRTPNPGDADFDPSKPKFFCMDMFPYPSGAGLHVGHPEGYTATDIISRYKRHAGYNVLHPMGWDAFGLPAEQYAIQTGVHPAQTTRKAIDNFRRQLKRFGFSYDWSREFATIDPDYYKWTQWIWLKAYDSWYDTELNKARPISELKQTLDNGSAVCGLVPSQWQTMSDPDKRSFLDSHRLAYLAEQTVNWCPKLGTVLANEEVIDGRSERGGHPVYRRPLKQWMFRITAYAERLLTDLALVDWPESTRVMQTAWIGRSEGAEIDFDIADAPAETTHPSIRVFTTRPDTIFGATYMVLAPEHPIVEQILAAPSDETDVQAVQAYVETTRHKSDVDRQVDSKDKTGVFTGWYAINPATQGRIPIWIADYVLMGYGHGAIMAVPGHDQRDFDFAKAFHLPIAQVVAPADGAEPLTDAPLEANGVAVNSANDKVSLDGLPTLEAKARIINWIEQAKRGRHKINYRLRDWLFSRQRYWGEPFPVVFDDAGNHYPVDEAHLPVVLPDMADYQPIESEDPLPLLGKVTDWVHTTAGEAGVSPDQLPPETPVKRETNTMPGWAGSCWYYLRYCDPQNTERFVSSEAERYWMAEGSSGVDLYIGGAEHAVLHLLYARFWHKMLYDLGEVSTPEPFAKLFHQGMITSFAYQRSDKSLVPIDEVQQNDDGAYIETASGQPVTQVIAKMSKSLKNVQNPDDVIAEYGADTFRLYEMYLGPLEASKPWNPRDIAGLYRFLQRTWRMAVDEDTGELRLAQIADETLEKQLHRTIAKVGDDIERIALNTAIAAMIEFVNAATAAGSLSRDQLERFAITLSPFVPHIAEELWSKLGHSTSIANAAWPTVDPALLRDDEIEIPVQILGKVRGKITVAADADQSTVEHAALNDDKIAPLLEGKTVRKVVVVPGKIVNIVAN